MRLQSIMKIVFLVACALWTMASRIRIYPPRESAPRAQCINNQKQLLLALHNYHEAYNAFPPAYIADATGKPMHSWRVLILPYLEQDALYNEYDFDEPWNGPNNIKLLDKMPVVFACPTGPYPTKLTSYVAIRGPGTIFPGRSWTRVEDMTDGTGDTLMLVEAVNAQVPWSVPQDLDVRTMSFRINDPKCPSISSKHPGGANVSCADGSCRFLRESISPGNVRALMTIAGGEGITANQAFSGK
jgi:hypothetical protein